MSTETLNNPFRVLSKKELVVLTYLIKGYKIKDISSTLNLKSNTISTFKRNIHLKLGTDNPIELFKLTQKHDLEVNDLNKIA